jgi:hypothetical protein
VGGERPLSPPVGLNARRRRQYLQANRRASARARRAAAVARIGRGEARIPGREVDSLSE